MKRLKKMIITLLLFSAVMCMFTHTYALESSQKEALKTDELYDSVPASAQKMLGNADGDDLSGVLKMFETLKENIRSGFKKALGAAAENIGTLMAVSLAVSLIGVICPNGKWESYVGMAGVCAVAVISLDGVGSAINEGLKAADDIYTFSKVLLPTVAAATAASGAVTTSGAQYAWTSIAMDALITAENDIIVPLIYAYFVVSTGSIAFDNKGLKSAATVIKQLVVTSMTAMTLGLTLYLSVSGIVLGAADDAAAKVAKTAMSTLLPIVGSILSDASGAVISGMNTVKNVIGVFGLAVVSAIAAMPIIRFMLNSLMLKASAAFSGAIGGGKTAEMIGALSGVYTMIMGLCASSAVMLFVSVISSLRAVTGV